MQIINGDALESHIVNVIKVIVLVLRCALVQLKVGWQADYATIHTVLLKEYMHDIGAHVAVYTYVAGELGGDTYTI